MIAADRVIAGAIMVLSLYFMWHATALPIGWNGETGGPGGGAFPFWLSAIMLIAAGGVLAKSFKEDAEASVDFDLSMVRSVVSVIIALVVSVDGPVPNVVSVPGIVTALALATSFLGAMTLGLRFGYWIGAHHALKDLKA